MTLASLGKTVGAVESNAWLSQRGLSARQAQWYVEVEIISDTPGVRFEINIYPEEWGFVFRDGIRVTSIRVTDIAFVHGLDDHGLLRHTPALERISDLLGKLEQRYGMAFDRERPAVRSNLVDATAVVAPWLGSRHA